MRSPRPFLGALVLALVALNLWVTLARSWIPFAVDGPVDAIDVRREKHPGVDDVVRVVVADSSPRQLDPRVAAHLRVGDVVRKDAWSPELHLPGRTIPLAPSPDFRGMCFVAAVLLAVAGLLLAQRLPPGSVPPGLGSGTNPGSRCMDGIHRAWLFRELRTALARLAADGDEALASLPDGCCKADELALDFDNLRSAIVGNFATELPSALVAALRAVDAAFEPIQGEGWSDGAVRSGSDWVTVRQRAKVALRLLDRYESGELRSDPEASDGVGSGTNPAPP